MTLKGIFCIQLTLPCNQYDKKYIFEIHNQPYIKASKMRTNPNKINNKERKLS